jgi:hypothetical protein
MSLHDNEYHGHVLHPREQNEDVRLQDGAHHEKVEPTQEEGTTRLAGSEGHSAHEPMNPTSSVEGQNDSRHEEPRGEEITSRLVTGEEHGSNDRPETVEEARHDEMQPGMASARTMSSPDQASFDFENEHPEPQKTNSALSVDIKDFDKLSVAQVIKQAKTFSKEQLNEAIEHEKTHRKRKTLIAKLENLAKAGKSKE